MGIARHIPNLTPGIIGAAAMCLLSGCPSNQGIPASGLAPDAGTWDSGIAFDSGTRSPDVAADTGLAPTPDSGALDAGPMDVGPLDAGPVDSGPLDSGPVAPVDAGPVDAGPVDTGPVDSGPVDTGPVDSGPVDAGPKDVGTPDAGPKDAGPKDSGGTPGLNKGFIGSACGADFDCSYSDAFCLKSIEGFPNGMCSKGCTKFCPDKTGMATTFCIAGSKVKINNPPGLCAMQCDFGASSTGCRPGYQCVALPRYNDPKTTKFVCIPGAGQGYKLGACHKKLQQLGVGFAPAINPKDHPKTHPNHTCDQQEPIWVAPVMHGVTFHPSKPSNTPKPMLVTCGLALALEKSAKYLEGQGISKVVHWGTYNCRVISGTSTLSEHGLANAIDFRGFVTGAGLYWTVLGDWEKGKSFPVTTAGKFLKDFTMKMFQQDVYNIILTPEFNKAHADHFHADLTPGAKFLN